MTDLDLQHILEAILFASGDPIRIDRISLILEEENDRIIKVANDLSEAYNREERGIRILRLGNKLQMCSAPEYSDLVIKALEHRKPPKLSAPALETMSIIAYFQPVTKAYIDQVRGVDSSYTISVLIDKGLIEKSGTLDVPGRPSLYSTSDAFLRVMDINDLSELPILPECKSNESIAELQKKIENLEEKEASGSSTNS